MQEFLQGYHVGHIVLDIEDIDRHLSGDEEEMLDDVLNELKHCRRMAGQTEEDQYIVINMNEDPIMLQEIVKILKRHGKWEKQ